MYCIPQVLHVFRVSEAKSSCICTIGFFFGGGFGGVWALSLRSTRGSFAGVLGFACFLNIENTGRRFWSGGGELRGVGDDGGLDRDGSSEKMAGDSLGLDVGGVEVSRTGEEISGRETISAVFRTSVSILAIVLSTRLRLVGGSAS